MTFMLFTKNYYGFSCLEGSFIKQDTVYLLWRFNSLIHLCLLLPEDELQSV